VESIWYYPALVVHKLYELAAWINAKPIRQALTVCLMAAIVGYCLYHTLISYFVS
jgi:hypothetical protein